MIIDAHHHFWQYQPAEYPWISESMGVLCRDFLPADLQQEIEVTPISGAISVQARQTIGETEWLLDLADGNAFICGIVGWIPLISPDLQPILERLTTREKLLAVRHVLQDEPDDAYMLRDDFNRGIGLLKEFELAYDILIFERQIPQALQLVDRHPDQTFVLDHVAKPRIREGIVSPWRENLRELSRRPNVYCKLSGLATEADHHSWSERQLRPYMEVVLEAFGPGRLMFGSDWPVCLLASPYARWYELVRRFASTLTVAEQAQLFGATAIKAYGL